MSDSEKASCAVSMFSSIVSSSHSESESSRVSAAGTAAGAGVARLETVAADVRGIRGVTSGWRKKGGSLSESESESTVRSMITGVCFLASGAASIASLPDGAFGPTSGGTTFGTVAHV